MSYHTDRDITRESPGYRRILLHLTPDRDHAAVFFSQTIDLVRTLPWLEEHTVKTGRKLGILALFTAAAGRMLHEHPNLNRYAAGWRVYQRDGVYVTLSTKRELKHGAPVVMLKIPIHRGDDPDAIADRITATVGGGRSTKQLPVEKEVATFLHIPGFILSSLVRVFLWLDRRHWLPGFFVDPDPMFTSLVIANLGSVGMDSAYHHLYEYGNCPFFAIIGRIHDEPVVVDGHVEVHPVVEIRYTFDERIEDGLACALALAGAKELVEDPLRWTTGITDWGDRPPPHV